MPRLSLQAESCSASNAYTPVVAGKSRRYRMAPAHIPVFLFQKPSTKNGISWSAIVFLAWYYLLPLPSAVDFQEGAT